MPGGWGRAYIGSMEETPSSSVLTGAGAAFAAVNCLKLIANWFPFRHFAFMTGLMMTLAMPDVRERLVAQGLYPIGGTPADLTARMKSDYEKWGALIRKLNLKPE